MPFNSKKAGKALGKALGKPFTAMYASGGEFPVSIPTPAERTYEQRAPLGSENEARDETREQGPAALGSQTPAEMSRPTTTEAYKPAAVTLAPPPASFHRHDLPFVTARTRPDSRPESKLLPDAPFLPGVYRDERHAMTSPPPRPEFAHADSYAESTRSSTLVDNTEDHMRQLFNALPPEAQALAYTRLAEQRERERELEARREQAAQWEAEAEARIEHELREKERALRARQPAGLPDQHSDAYDGAYLSSPARAPPPLSGRHPAEAARSPTNFASPRRQRSPQEEFEEQIAQLLEAQTLPPRAPSRHTSLRRPPAPPSHDPPRTLSDPSAPRAIVPPRPVHSPRTPRTYPDVPRIDGQATPLSRPTGDTEVRAALAAKIRALQAALDTLDVTENAEVADESDFYALSAPSTMTLGGSRAGSPEVPLSRPGHTPTPSGWNLGVLDPAPDVFAKPERVPRFRTHSRSASRSHPADLRATPSIRSRAATPLKVLELDAIPPPRAVSPRTVQRPLPLELEPSSRPTSLAHFVDGRRAMQTPPPEYAAGPQFPVRLEATIDPTALF
ncbi:hypothetical protein CC85DRAFT_152360 [Cutaneotrichosporon oleaginosum]|uniref:Uncharacterized protein n=1 Tax=Cutaneotrichosporon oleaginosum TaxID=879819 RepID=A0A0J0XVU5_9TREE|nr:uncharacterized protein CC85DRAFT_152360 [Cutaneotrichosporon oleaginosum]KLT45202.1 hypothetical protein CC85DRAFT_152360 [Cutaneotrichosporon oleaginosum]TXT14962.1 hypothetical protein COLE_01155 [Cutaneotrichosporon oleaginosum]